MTARLQLGSIPSVTGPFTERCDGCYGEGHIGGRVPSAQGPCELCWGTGRAYFAFDLDDRLAAPNVPIRDALRFGLVEGALRLIQPPTQEVSK
jgi:hypothetical protein